MINTFTLNLSPTSHTAIFPYICLNLVNEFWSSWRTSAKKATHHHISPTSKIAGTRDLLGPIPNKYLFLGTIYQFGEYVGIWMYLVNIWYQPCIYIFTTLYLLWCRICGAECWLPFQLRVTSCSFWSMVVFEAMPLLRSCWASEPMTKEAM